MSPRQELDQSLMHMFTCPQPDDRHVIGDRRFMWSVQGVLPSGEWCETRTWTRPARTRTMFGYVILPSG